MSFCALSCFKQYWLLCLIVTYGNERKSRRGCETGRTGTTKVGYRKRSEDASKERLRVWLGSRTGPRAGGHPREEKESVFVGRCQRDLHRAAGGCPRRQ